MSDVAVALAENVAERPSGLWRDAGRRFLGHRMGVAAAAFLVALAITCLLAGVVQGGKSERQDALRPMERPSAEHWLGTDRLGRDLLARVLAGGRVSLGVSIATALTALVIGTGVGLGVAALAGWPLVGPALVGTALGAGIGAATTNMAK